MSPQESLVLSMQSNSANGLLHRNVKTGNFEMYNMQILPEGPYILCLLNQTRSENFVVVFINIIITKHIPLAGNYLK